MNPVIAPIIVALIPSLNLQAPTVSNTDELAQLLKDFLAGASRNDAETTFYGRWESWLRASRCNRSRGVYKR
jgi:hypothetical protein